MKYFVIIVAVILTLSSLSYAQVNFVDITNFSAQCLETSNDYSSRIDVYKYKDSIIIDACISFQCCAEYEVKKSCSLPDTLIVTIKDTAAAQCDCICKFDFWINLGPYSSNIKKISINGKYYDLLAEKYRPLLEVNKQWNVLGLIPGLDYTFPKLYKYSIKSESGRSFCWNGKRYLTVETEVKGGVENEKAASMFVREENGKVFLLDTSDIAFTGCNECLLYDFTAETGDILHLGYDSITYSVEQVGYDSINGRRCLTLNDISSPELMSIDMNPPQRTKWIEGIGDLRGLLESKNSLFITGSYNILTCCSVKDVLLYHNTLFPECGERPPYQFFLNEGKKWTYVHRCWLEGPSISVDDVVVDETNLSGNNYARRFYPFSNGVNEYFQEENGKVFAIFFDERFLIYDFTLNKGDSILLSMDQQKNYFLVDSIKYLQYEDEKYRKTMYLSALEKEYGNQSRIWIEGIGDALNPLYYWMPVPTNGCSSDLACCSNNDIVAYRDSKYPDCGEDLALHPISQDPIKIFPNPSIGEVYIQYSDNCATLNYNVHSISGQIIEAGFLKNGQILNLDDGIYILEIYNEKRVLRKEKLVIY